MRDNPQGTDLLTEARRTLIEKVLPTLSSETRFNTLMVLRAMDLAERELRASTTDEKQIAEGLRQLVAFKTAKNNNALVQLSEGIRQGNFDSSENLYQWLQLMVTFKLKETNPS